MLLNSTQRSRRSQRACNVEGTLLINRMDIQAFSDIILDWREMDSIIGKKLKLFLQIVLLFGWRDAADQEG